ncbi:hypothetical protein O6027_17755 [Sphingomonas aerolata]|uniref:hypothetical protein n=1 Tax=Sphingomonas aerolata TaxID=185951 RepID=UPI00335F6F78
MFDPTQPMIMDSDGTPNRGAGYWYANHLWAEEDDAVGCDETPTPASRRTSIILFLLILSGVLIGAAHMIFA